MGFYSKVVDGLKGLPAWVENLSFVTTTSGRLAPSVNTEEAVKQVQIEAAPEDALLFGSKREPGTPVPYSPWYDTSDGEPYPRYALLLDLDVPATLVRSSTKSGDHYHLYVDVAMTKPQHDAVLKALKEAGILQPGFADSGIRSEFGATLRLPWVKKGEDETLRQQQEPPI